MSIPASVVEETSAHDSYVGTVIEAHDHHAITGKPDVVDSGLDKRNVAGSSKLEELRCVVDNPGLDTWWGDRSW